jgi:hypothetical protein
MKGTSTKGMFKFTKVQTLFSNWFSSDLKYLNFARKVLCELLIDFLFLCGWFLSISFINFRGQQKFLL